jgi:hypothetical protein
MVSPEEARIIAERLKAMNRNSLLLGAPGLVLQGVGNTMKGVPGGLLLLVGSALLVAGLAIYARMRGQSPWLGLLGLLSCLGMVVLVLLPKKCQHCGATTKGATCAACGAPAPQ